MTSYLNSSYTTQTIIQILDDYVSENTLSYNKPLTARESHIWQLTEREIYFHRNDYITFNLYLGFLEVG